MTEMFPFDQVLTCPYCNRVGTIALTPTPSLSREAICTACHQSLPLYEGVPDFAPHIPAVRNEATVSLIQRLNNSRFFAFYYEKPVWRPLLTRIGSWLSVEEETRIVLNYAELSNRPLRIGDFACGTGSYTRAFAERCPTARVYGLDLSLNMLHQAQKRIVEEEIKNVTFLRGDLYKLPFADGGLDRVNCCGVLHLFSNLEPVWKEISRVLAEGGIFTGWVLTYAPNAFSRIQKRIRNYMFLHLFRPQQLAADLERVGITSFHYEQHHLWLLFRAIKKR